MPRQLNIRSDEAFELARKLVRRTGLTATAVITRALRNYDAELTASEQPLGPEAQRRYEELRALAKQTAEHKRPGATSDHRDMYDEFGLPK